jgi:hypothetical protein
MFTPDGAATPARLTPEFGQVVRMSSRSSGDALGISVQVQKQFAHGVEFNALYSYSHAKDLMSPVNLEANLNLGNTPLDGTLEDRSLRTSYFGTSHRVWLGGSIDLPFGVRFSMLYAGSRQEPYTYVVLGDANGDGIGEDGASGPNNDIVYVPANVAPGGDISLVVRAEDGTLAPAPQSQYDALDAFIEGDSCLRQQRGRIMELNSCRNGWNQIMQLRLTKRLATVGGQALEVSVEGINLFHEGKYRPKAFNPLSSGGPQIPMLRLAGYDHQAGRGHYELALPQRNVRFGERWGLKLGARYTF